MLLKSLVLCGSLVFGSLAFAGGNPGVDPNLELTPMGASFATSPENLCDVCPTCAIQAHMSCKGLGRGNDTLKAEAASTLPGAGNPASYDGTK